MYLHEEPRIPSIAAGAGRCVDLSNASSVDECPGHSVCFPGNLPWISPASPFYDSDGTGFCACATMHGLGGDDCMQLTPVGTLQLTADIVYACIAVVCFIVNLADAFFFVRRVRAASAAQHRNAAFELARRSALPNVLREEMHEQDEGLYEAGGKCKENDKKPAMSSWYWLSSDPAFTLLFTTAASCLCLLIATMMEMKLTLSPNPPQRYGNSRYKTDKTSFIFVFTFLAHGMNNVGLMLVGVAWLRIVYRAGARKSSPRRRPAPSALSRFQYVALRRFEGFLRVLLFIYPIIGALLYIYEFSIPLLILGYAISLFMCCTFALGSVLLRRLLSRIANNHERPGKNSGENIVRNERAYALLRAQHYIRRLSMSIGVGMFLVYLAGSLAFVDFAQNGFYQLLGREPPSMITRVRIWTAYLAWIGNLVVACGLSWFARRFTRGVQCACGFDTLMSHFHTSQDAGTGRSRRTMRFSSRKQYPTELNAESDRIPDFNREVVSNTQGPERRHSFTILEVHRPLYPTTSNKVTQDEIALH